MQDFKNLLASYNQVLPLKTEPLISEPVSRFDKLLELYSSMPKKDSSSENTLETPLDITLNQNSDEYGFQGFTYTAPKESTEILTQKENPILDNNQQVSSSLNIVLAINFFKSKGFNRSLIGGILGNLIGESQLNPKAVNQLEKNAKLSGYGRGIALWSNSRVNDFKKVIGINPEEASLDLQLLFAWYEMQQRPALIKALRNSTTVELATDAIYRGFENGSAGALASPELLTRTYGRSWKKLGYKPYNFQNELNARIRNSKKALTYIN